MLSTVSMVWDNELFHTYPMFTLARNCHHGEPLILYQHYPNIYIYIYICNDSYRSRGLPKAFFGIATATTCNRRQYSFLGIAQPLIHTLKCSVKQCSIMNHFLSLCMSWPGIEPWSPGPLANRLILMPIYIYIYIERERFIRIDTHDRTVLGENLYEREYKRSEDVYFLSFFDRFIRQ